MSTTPEGAEKNWQSIMRNEDWIVVFSGLFFGIAIFSFLLICTTTGRDERRRVFSGTVFWLLLSGTIHGWIEGMFVFYRDTYPSMTRAMNLYGAGDLRYGSPLEEGTAAMEAITAVLEGPMCILAAYAFVHQTKWRHPLQLVLCTMQIYGLVWFSLHPLFCEAPQVSHDPFLFWVIVVGCNGPWAIVPPMLWLESFKAIVGAMPGKSSKKNV